VPAATIACIGAGRDERVHGHAGRGDEHASRDERVCRHAGRDERVHGHAGRGDEHAGRGDKHAGRGDEHAGRNERVVEHGVADVDGGGEGR
jgi:hypothetical protein